MAQVTNLLSSYRYCFLKDHTTVSVETQAACSALPYLAIPHEVRITGIHLQSPCSPGNMALSPWPLLLLLSCAGERNSEQCWGMVAGKRLKNAEISWLGKR